MSGSVLLVEDDRNIAAVIREALFEVGFDVTTCEGLAERNAALASRPFDVMLTDVILADGDGLDSIADVRRVAPTLPIIVLSAQNSLDTAVRASDNDVFEYFPKPFDLDELTRAACQAVSARSRGPMDDSIASDSMPLIGRSAAMQNVFRLITRVLRNDLTVLITGESGTGKELVAEAIHQLGSRKSGPFVAVNMAAIPHDLLESELFGHERGAFTGAVAQVIGKFEQANGGTLFLDEIGDMPAEAQTRLLRALQAGRIRRVGGRHEIDVNVRIVAATNRELSHLIAQGRFREDLYYRLAVVPIHLPPLSERREDIAALVAHFLRQAAREGLPQRTVDRDALSILEEAPWRGNIRELRNVVFRLALLARDETIDAQTVVDCLGQDRFPALSNVLAPLDKGVTDWLTQTTPRPGKLYELGLAAFERPLFEHALRTTGGNQLQAAQLLGINRNTLRKRLTDLGITADLYVRRR